MNQGLVDLFVVTAVNQNQKLRMRCANIWLSETDAFESIESNHFDLWEGFTNKYVVVEKMKVGQPWTCEEVQWFTRERFQEQEGEPLDNGIKTVVCKAYIYKVDRPKEYYGICNFGVG